ncbi:MAG: LLM class flavin-dependent oxidoreductase [Acidimicrobiia bacterium]
MSGSLGLVLGSTVGPSKMVDSARAAEKAGFDELWLSEDFFFSGGIAGAGIALSATQSIAVGLGVVSALVRHPALLAMEFATIASAHPGRFLPGIGLGVPAWMRQMGLMPSSPLAAVRECVSTVQRLLTGEVVDHEGAVFESHDVSLVYRPQEPLPIRLGVLGPKMLRLSGQIADGSILSVAAGADYVNWARQRIDEGREQAGRASQHSITVFAIYAIDDDRERARAAARSTLAFYKAAGGRNALTDVAGISDDLQEMRARGGADLIETEMPESWVDELAVAGTPREVRERIGRLFDAGADSVALVPAQRERLPETLALTKAEVIGRI